MPNWCTNTVKIEGLKDIIKRNENGSPDFSFNDIRPMPECMNVKSGSSNDTDIMVYMTNKLTTKYDELDQEKFVFLMKNVTNMFSNDWLARVWDRCQGMNDEQLDKSYKAGEILCNNIKEYGCMTWYEWCNQNWGTKWDCCEPDYDNLENDEITFYTAWGPPVGVLEEMSRKYPNKEVTCEWREEGGFSGYLAFLNGECTVETEEKFSYDDEEC